MWLLDFLLTAYRAVLDWFSEKYWYYVGLVKAIPATIAAIGNNILYYYNQAKAAIGTLINSFYNSTIKPIILSIQDKIAEAYGLAYNAYNKANNFLVDLTSKLNALKQVIFDAVHSWYDSLIENLQNKINKILTQDIPRLIGNINTLLPFQAWLASAASALNIDNIKKAINDFNAIKDNLIVFMSNPLGFILGLFWQYALMFLSYVIGYALGSTQTDLPPIPNWTTITKK